MERTSQIVDINGPVHYIDHGGTGPAIVMVHGLGGSHLNWELLGPDLATDYHPYAVDLRGFGLTPLDGHIAALRSQVALLLRFVNEVAGGSAVVFGTSMGGLISMMLAANHPAAVDGLVLLDPALPMRSTRNVTRATITRLGVPVLPWIGEEAVRRLATSGTPEERIDATWAIVTARPNRIDAATRANAVEMTRLRDGMEWAPKAYCEAIRSTTATLGRRRRFRDMIHRIAAPTLLVHGMLDDIVHFEGAEWLAGERPDWRFAPIPDAGHVPQLELPQRTLNIFRDWADRSLSAV
jgi:pimeloyl-ACP methyl ester carboxylesterase